MKVSEKWLRSFVAIHRPIQEIAKILTMRGLEVEQITPVATALDGVVIAEILSTIKHPNADRLKVCQVNDGIDILTIVCGAPNARAGIKVALAKIGAVLPQILIKKSKIRDIESHGMLCSVSELGLAEQSQGIMELPVDAPLGQGLTAYLELDDNVLDISITPNRGDCISVLGIAREIAAIQGIALLDHDISAIINETSLAAFPLAIKNHALTLCPHYLARTISGINPSIESPLWLKEKLRRSGIRSIALAVDVTNYVMLALGQPMHVFDLQNIIGDVEIRCARPGECISLLNESLITLNDTALVIADQQGPIALAGIMGGAGTAVATNTCDILLECAHFDPENIAHTARHYNLASDSCYRFERGVDPALPARAMTLATQMIVDIAGGMASVVQLAGVENVITPPREILLRYAKLEKVLGVIIAPEMIKRYFFELVIAYKEVSLGLVVTVPSYRFDLKIEEDLIEEVLRIHGCDVIVAVAPKPALSLQSPLLAAVNLDAERMLLKTRGYDEIISYSFVDEKLQIQLAPHQKALKLINPISQEMSVMRTTLWTGLLTSLIYNLHRQQTRVRLFESGLCFLAEGAQPKKLSGLSYGRIYPESWDNVKDNSDFFDIKNDILSLLAENNVSADYHFLTSKNSALHPTQAARLVHKKTNRLLGEIGVLHPQLVQALNLPLSPVLFELDIEVLRQSTEPKKFSPLCKFPEMRRDLSFLLPIEVIYQHIVEAVQAVDHQKIQHVYVFDVYQGPNVPQGYRSIAIALIFQDFFKTLTDDEVAILIKKVIDLLQREFKATLRDGDVSTH